MITVLLKTRIVLSLRHLTVNAIVIRDNQVLRGKRGAFKGKPLVESGKMGVARWFF